MTKNKTADRCRYCHAECSLPSFLSPPPPPSPSSMKGRKKTTNNPTLLFCAEHLRKKKKKSIQVTMAETCRRPRPSVHRSTLQSCLCGLAVVGWGWLTDTEVKPVFGKRHRRLSAFGFFKVDKDIFESGQGGSLCWYFCTYNLYPISANKKPKVLGCFILDRVKKPQRQSWLSRYAETQLYGRPERSLEAPQDLVGPADMYV